MKEKPKLANGTFIKTHGMCNTSEYMSWAAMKKRCLNPDKAHIKYTDVKICQEWIDSFESFLTDMGKKPTNKHTIDRKDNSKGYYKENCRWATRSEQSRNYSLNRIIEFKGQKKCITEWSEIIGISRQRIYQRLDLGWSIEDALTTPIMTKMNRKNKL